MKVIFLDIDGVLNTEVFTRATYAIAKRVNKSIYDIIMDEYGHYFDPMAVDMLGHIIKETGAKIVVSSTWRASGLNVMQTMWEIRDLPGEVIDITCFMNTERGEEIAEWLRANQVDSYVIIDDDSDMLPEQFTNFVQTNPAYGITYPDSLKAIQILKPKPEEK